MIAKFLAALFALLLSLTTPAADTYEHELDAPPAVATSTPAPAEPTLPPVDDPDSGMGPPAAVPGPVGVPPGFSPVTTSIHEQDGD